MAKGQAERLVPVLQDLLSREGVTWADLTALAVGTGPGNFTGIRIAVSLVRGLALGLNIPAAGVTGFEALASRAGVLPFWTLIAAPRGQVYAQRFPDGRPTLVDLSAVPRLDARHLHGDDFGPADLVAAVAEVGSVRARSHPPRPAPFYLRGAVASPASDPPPVILP